MKMLAVEQIKGDEYMVEHDTGAHTVIFKGTIRLQTSDEYLPLTQLLQAAHTSAVGDRLSLDFRQLQFLNSSGISTISKFVIGARKQDKLQLNVLGNRDIYWQQKSLGNLQKLWAKVQIEII
jgi:hypothetical protein